MMKFTVLIDSVHRERNDPFVAPVTVKTFADIEFAAVAEYNRQHEDAMAFAEHEALLIAVCAGEARFAWNPEGLTRTDISHAIMAGEMLLPLHNLAPSEAPVWGGRCLTGRTSSRQDEPELPGAVSSQLAAGIASHELAEAALKGSMKYQPSVRLSGEELKAFREAVRRSMTDIPAWAIRPIEHDAMLAEPVSLEHITLVEDIKVNVRQKTRFPEMDKLAIISTSHISAENLRALDSQQANNDLPYWIVSTGFGYIIRFETAVQNWQAGCESQPDLMHPFREAHLDDTFSALCVELKDYGFNGMHLDADADEIEGLQTYEHS